MTRQSPPHETPPGVVSPAPPLRIFAKVSYLLGARWFQEGLQTVFFIYLARTSTTAFGEFMMALGLGSILLMVAEFGLNLPLVRLASGPREELAATLSHVLTLKGVCFLLAGLGAVAFVAWQAYPWPLARLLLIIGLGLALEAFASTFFVVLQVEGRQGVEAQIRAVATLGGFGFGLAALAAGAPPLIVGCFKLIDSSFKLAGGLWLVWHRARLKWRPPRFGQLMAVARLGLLFALMEITASIYNKANLFFLQRQAGSVAVAQYSAAWQVVDGFSCLVANLILQNILYPVFVRLWQQDRAAVRRLAQQTAAWLLAAALVLMYVLGMGSDRLIPLIFGPDFPDAVWLQRLLVVTILIAFWHNLAMFLLLSMRREKVVLALYFLGLTVNLLWCSLLLPRAPLPGAAWAIIVTKGVVALGTIYLAQARLRFLTIQKLRPAVYAMAAAALLYTGGQQFLPRDLAELLPLLPLLLLVWHCWLTQRP